MRTHPKTNLSTSSLYGEYCHPLSRTLSAEGVALVADTHRTQLHEIGIAVERLADKPFSPQGNIDLLKRAGFVDILTVMKYLCFEGFLSIK